MPSGNVAAERDIRTREEASPGNRTTGTEPIRPGGVSWLRPSVLALILANALPTLGVLAWGWEVFALVLLYWFENVVIGAFNVLRMLIVRPDDIGRWIGKAFMIPFFVVHYGGFAAIHGLFVFAVFGGDAIAIDGFIPPPSAVWRALVETGAVYAALALVASHGFSFARNYVGSGEYRRITLEKLMQRPYGRVVVLHVVIILGGFVVLALGSPVPGLLLLVALKTATDVKAHVAERDKLCG